MLSDSETLFGDTFFLRPLDESDIELIRCWRNKDHIRNNFLDNQLILPEQQRKWYRKYVSDSSDCVFIIEDNDLKMPVGAVSLYNYDCIGRTAEFGRLMIGESLARGKGLGMKATALLCNYGLNALGLTSIYLQVFKDNHRAIKIYEAVGFRVVQSGPVLDDRLIRMELYPSSTAVEFKTSELLCSENQE